MYRAVRRHELTPGAAAAPNGGFELGGRLEDEALRDAYDPVNDRALE